jgi:F-type H+-transporting ATPase subunit epsilon
VAKKSSFRCQLVTPTASLIDAEVSYASIPAWDGMVGVLPGRAPLLARLGLGELRLDLADTSKGEASKAYMVEGGFVRMTGTELTILAEKATPVDQLDLAAAESELRKLASASPASGADQLAAADRLTADRARARMKVHLAQKRR